MQNELNYHWTVRLDSEFQCAGRHCHVNVILKDFLQNH